MKRPDWYLSTVRRLYQYPLDKKRLELLQVKLETTQPTTTASYNLAPGSSGISDQTGKIGTNRAEVGEEIKELKKEVHQVDQALSVLDYESRRLIEMRYFSGETTDAIVYRSMHMSDKPYYAMRDKIVSKLAYVMHYLGKSEYQNLIKQ